MTQYFPSGQTTVKPSQSFQNRLAAYAISAGAAGVGVFCLAPAAEAKVVYTPANVKITIGEFPLDLNNDGITDFNLLPNGQTNGHSNSTYFSAIPVASGNKVWGHGGDGAHRDQSVAFDLPAGATVGPNQEAAQPTGRKALAVRYSVRTTGGRSYGGFAGDWANDGKGVDNRYLGFAFTVDGETHFGWARLNVDFRDGAFAKGILTGYAYETEPNTAIVTGDTQNAETAVAHSQKSTLGSLALGASGIGRGK